MEKLFNYDNGTLRIILNEQPMINNYCYSQHRDRIKIKTIPQTDSYLFGIEFSKNQGGRICYGLLAAQIISEQEPGFVKYSIDYTDNSVVKYESTILYNNMFVYKGLPKEYLEQVKNSIISTILAKNYFPLCEINFKYAANCRVGSSPMFFGIIAETIVKIIFNNSAKIIFDMNEFSFAKEYMESMNLLL